jgi:PAP2 superfamily
MTIAVIRSTRARIVGRPGCWLSVRHSLRVEAAAALTLYGLNELTRDLVLGALYPPFVVLVIVATGNHFFLDAAAGALVAGHGAALAALLTRRPVTARG